MLKSEQLLRMDPRNSDSETGALSAGEGQQKRKCQRRFATGKERTTNLAHYSGDEKDVLNAAKQNLKLLIYTQHAFPDITSTNNMIKESYSNAAEQLNIPEDSGLSELTGLT